MLVASELTYLGELIMLELIIAFFAWWIAFLGTHEPTTEPLPPVEVVEQAPVPVQDAPAVLAPADSVEVPVAPVEAVPAPAPLDMPTEDQVGESAYAAEDPRPADLPNPTWWDQEVADCIADNADCGHVEASAPLADPDPVLDCMEPGPFLNATDWPEGLCPETGE
jgi:hypothetical protein